MSSNRMSVSHVDGSDKLHVYINDQEFAYSEDNIEIYLDQGKTIGESLVIIISQWLLVNGYADITPEESQLILTNF